MFMKEYFFYEGLDIFMYNIFMKYILLIPFIVFTFSACSKKPKVMFSDLPKTPLTQTSFEKLPNWDKENYNEALSNFLNSCKSKRTRKLYENTCEEAKSVKNAKVFLEEKFLPFTISSEKEGLLTGYYEPELKGSLKKTLTYKYPVHTTPKDLIIVDLSSVYPDLKNYRLRGKIKGNRLVPYTTRAQSSSTHIPSDVICYVDSKIDLFFLEIQGSGRVTLEDGSVLYLGYDNQNGHKYRAIGRYLVQIGALELKNVSLQSIRAWLDENPLRVDEVLNYNDSLVFFGKRKQSATGSLGLCLTASRSIAVDRRYIPLGSMLYLSSIIDEKKVQKIVFAQDTGGAIKGKVRADMFLGCGNAARESAGKLKSALKLWILLPREKKKIYE